MAETTKEKRPYNGECFAIPVTKSQAKPPTRPLLPLLARDAGSKRADDFLRVSLAFRRPHRQRRINACTALLPLHVLSGVLIVVEQADQVVHRQPPQATTITFAHRAIRQGLLLLLQFEDALLDGVGDDEPLHLDRACLADTVRAIDGLVLGCRVPGEVERYDLERQPTSVPVHAGIVSDVHCARDYRKQADVPCLRPSN